MLDRSIEISSGGGGSIDWGMLPCPPSWLLCCCSYVLGMWSVWG